MATQLALPLLLSTLLLLLLLPGISHAHLRFAHTLGNHMVLQRAPHQAAIYGHADALAPVAVTVAVQKQRDASTTMTVVNGVRA